MVSFSCEVCNETVIKKKLDQHKQRCRGAYFTCIDCSNTFQGTDYKSHTQCITEDEKYQKKLYKPKGKKLEKVPEQILEKSKPETKKLAKPKKSKALDLPGSVSKNTSLYELIKKLSSSQDLNKKKILKQLRVSKTDDGSVILTL